MAPNDLGDALPPYEPEIMPFERWADVSSRLVSLELEQRLELLDALEIDPRDFEASELHWGRIMAGEIARGDFTHANDYGVKCADEMKRRKAKEEAAK
jgi:hypothetical protein